MVDGDRYMQLDRGDHKAWVRCDLALSTPQFTLCSQCNGKDNCLIKQDIDEMSRKWRVKLPVFECPSFWEKHPSG
jgi:hypothetical protein